MKTVNANQQKAIQSILSQVDQLLIEAKFIGLFDERQSAILKSMTLLNGLESSLHVRDMIQEGKKALVNQFEEYAAKGGFQELKASDPLHFAKLWRAKYNKNPNF